MKKLELLATLWPSFPHFAKFAQDRRLSGIRLNSAMTDSTELIQELNLIKSAIYPLPPLFFDVKGRQLRVTEVHPFPDHLEMTINHPISVTLPQPVLFKGGSDHALLIRLEEGGTRLVFHEGPHYNVKPGESFHIRDASLRVSGPLFTTAELEKIEKVKKAGFKKYFLSYVEKQKDIDQFRELVGNDCEIWLKIENKAGLDFMANEFQKQDNLVAVAARGDLYVEVDKPHDILSAMLLIIEKDPEACVGSRLLLSIVPQPLRDKNKQVRPPEVPSCADFHELAWLRDIGYHRMMLCDELCLFEPLLSTAINAFESFKDSYVNPQLVPAPSKFKNLMRKIVGRA